MSVGQQACRKLHVSGPEGDADWVRCVCSNLNKNRGETFLKSFLHFKNVLFVFQESSMLTNLDNERWHGGRQGEQSYMPPVSSTTEMIQYGDVPLRTAGDH